VELQQWRARAAAAVVTGTAAAGAIVTYRAFRGDRGGDVLDGAYALVLAAGIAGFLGMVAIAILLSSRFTAEYARDPLWMGFRACAGAALVGLPTGTGTTPWSWPSFLTALTFSVVVTAAWAKFLVLFIADGERRRGGSMRRETRSP
jgi:hypothetical protein